MALPVAYQYQRALDEFRRLPDQPAPLLKRMSELISLLDLTTTLGSDLSSEEILQAALLIVMGEMQASRGALFVRTEGGFQLRAARGLPAESPVDAPLGALAEDGVLTREEGRHREAFDAFGFEVLCPVFRGGRAIALFGLGPRLDGRPYGPGEGAFLRSVAGCAATPIENGLIQQELQRVNRRLSVKVFQLNNLFDISRELTSSFDEPAIQNLVVTTLMGHLMVSRCALHLRRPGGLERVHERGVHTPEADRWAGEEETRAVLEALGRPMAPQELPGGAVRERLLQERMALVVPVSAGERVEGFLALGGRVSGAPFGEEDLEFAQTLGRQAQAALDNVRLQRVRLEKLRQDRELQIAREIQRSLFPRSWPEVPGFSVAARSDPCREVGGDHYDVIPLEGGRFALAVADVSGKGTPASILMASVHASLRALAGSARPDELMQRLNRFLFASTQANKFVTLFYAELDPAARTVRYVNGGHVPPFRIGADGGGERLLAGGPALGLLEDSAFEVGEAVMAPGDVLFAVTDGATEAANLDEEELGDERLCDVVRRTRRGAATEILEAVVGTVQAWTGPAGCSDDLTVLVLKAL